MQLSPLKFERGGSSSFWTPVHHRPSRRSHRCPPADVPPPSFLRLMQSSSSTNQTGKQDYRNKQPPSKIQVAFTLVLAYCHHHVANAVCSSMHGLGSIGMGSLPKPKATGQQVPPLECCLNYFPPFFSLKSISLSA